MAEQNNTKLEKKTDKRKITKNDVQSFLLRGRAFIALILVTTVFSLLQPQFMTTANIVIMSKHVAVNALLAIGMTFVILTAGIDLSVGSIVGMVAMIAGGLINEGISLPRLGIIIYPHTWLIIVLALILGTLAGAISGYIITRFKVAPFIATLGMLYVARGIAGLRRRFTFIEMMPRSDLLQNKFVSTREIDLSLEKLMDKLNEFVEKEIDRNHQIGHSYFLKVANADQVNKLPVLSFVWNHQIFPLLKEYFYSQHDKLIDFLSPFTDDGNEADFEEMLKEGDDLLFALSKIYAPE